MHTKVAGWRVLSSEMGGAAPADRAARAAVVAELYERHGGSLRRYATMLLADAADGEDVVHQVFGTLLTGNDVLREPLAFLRTSVRNAAFSRLRHRRTERDAAGQFLEPAAPACSVEERIALEGALRELPAEQREIVYLHIYEGMTFQEAADTTGTSINTVAARYRYALGKLRNLIA